MQYAAKSKTEIKCLKDVKIVKSVSLASWFQIPDVHNTIAEEIFSHHHYNNVLKPIYNNDLLSAY